MIPETREEMFLSAVADGSGTDLEPITREEMYLHAIATGGDTGLTPITRKEMFLDKILKSGGSGGGSGGSTGGGSGGSAVSVPAKEVNFYDYDGTLLHAYTVAEAQAMTELPALPERPGLICQGWNYDLETIKAYNRRVDVGATYTTDDGTTRIYIHLEDGRTSPMLGVCPNGTVTVDWGDGTEPDVLTGTSIKTVKWTQSHEYAKPGDYVIRLTVDGEVGFAGKSGSNQYAYILRSSSESDSRNAAYRNAIQRVEIGNDVTSVDAIAFHSCQSITAVVIPNSVTKIGKSAFANCFSLTAIVIPDSVTSVDSGAFSYCYTLKTIVFPDSVTNVYRDTLSYCSTLTTIVIPNGVTSVDASAFYLCNAVTSIVISGGVTSVDANAFYNCGSVRYYDFTKHSAVPTLSATNAFNGIAADCEIRVPAALYDEWIAATNWATYAANIVAV